MADLRNAELALDKMPQSESCRIIDFEQAKLVPGMISGTWFLHVQGVAPCLTMSVSLLPKIYIVRPDYWEVEVVACLHGISLPAQAPFSVAIDATAILGNKGIEVVGAGRTTNLDTPT